MKKQILFLLLFGYACSAGTPPVAVDFSGTWNLSEKVGERTFSSWLRIEEENGELKGLFLHRGGHPMPAMIERADGILLVTMLPEEESQNRSDVRWPTLTGRMQDGKLVGEGTDRRGETFSWVGERAPDRNEGSDRQVEWGQPIELFNGTDLAGWEPIGGRTNNWKAVEGVLSNESTGANLQTAKEFRDFKLSLEFKIPEGSNSGIYLRGRYETQVADDYGKKPYSRGVGGLYGQITPTVNACKPAGEWNTLEATLIGYRLTIAVNGQVTIDGKLIPGITGGALSSEESNPGPIMLQGDHGPVFYRNIVLTPAN